MANDSFQGFLLTRSWRDRPDGIELEFWFATDAGALRVLVPRVESVFFLAAEALPRARALITATPGVELRELDMRDFQLRPVAGIYCRSHRTARQLSDRLEAAGLEPLEADINPAERYLMERFITGGAEITGVPTRAGDFLALSSPTIRSASFRPSLRVVSFDIETAMDTLQLYSIAVHAYQGGDSIERVFMLGEGACQPYVQACSSQQALLEAFLDWVAQYDPDVLIGWNVIQFDCDYLQRIADSAAIPLRLGRDGRQAYWRRLDRDGERRTIECPGRVVLDGIELLRTAFYRFESFALGNVARELLGDSKLIQGGGRGEEIGRLFREDKTALAQYNLKDCELVSRIFKHTDLLGFAIARSAMTGLNLDRMGGSVASFDNLYLPRLHRSGYVAPNASREQLASPGGFVLDSTPGIYRHVLVLDFKSLYPSIIRTFGIDPLGLALGTSGTLPEDATVPGFIEARFARRGHILPALIEQLWQRRDAAKSAGDGPLSQAIKIIMNSFYGVLGTSGCRFFDARLASSITLRGHEILKRTRDRIESAGHRVIYGDTDSVFAWIAEADSDQAALAAGRALERDLNAWWKAEIRREFDLDSVLELEFETHYKRFLMPTVRGSDKGSKKRYAGVVAGAAGDQVVFKGLENVRTDWTRLARDFQQELYRRVFMDQPYQDYVRRVHAEVMAGARDAELVYRKRLRKPLAEYQRNIPPQVKAALLCEQRGLQRPARGDYIEYVITRYGPEPAGAAAGELDYEHYVEKQLQPVADGILAFLDCSYRGLVDTQLDLF